MLSVYNGSHSMSISQVCWGDYCVCVCVWVSVVWVCVVSVQCHSHRYAEATRKLSEVEADNEILMRQLQAFMPEVSSPSPIMWQSCGSHVRSVCESCEDHVGFMCKSSESQVKSRGVTWHGLLLYHCLVRIMWRSCEHHVRLMCRSMWVTWWSHVIVMWALYM